MLEVASAQGPWITTTDGKRYLDLISGISVSAMGHQHPDVVHAVQEQAAKHLHVMVYGEFVQSPQVRYAEWILDRLPAGLSSVYFTNSGTEATEGAMKLAKRITGRSHMVSCTNAYHGSSQGALSLAGGAWLKDPFGPLLPNCEQIEFNNFDDLEKITHQTACFMVEPVQAEAGAVAAQTGYLRAARERCQQVGALLVFDEIQTGFGRLGAMFACQKYGVEPDILLLGKALGGGMPLGAFISSAERMAIFSHSPMLGHITTFGGHPVSCAAGLAMCTALELSGVVAHVEAKGRYIARHIQGAEVRGEGLLMALVLENAKQVGALVDSCVGEGLITDWFLFNDGAVRVSPPLNISYDELDLAIEIINRGIAHVGA
ncbi:MAG: aspartate aminotransferase family protein [Bacteroidetes bacterium]|nr:aspartate aminotransferase family protein [Bacteroidota bacterium]